MSEKKSQLINVLIKGVGVIVLLVVMFIGYNTIQNRKYINIVKEQEYEGITYEALFERFSSEAVWKCVEKKRFTVVDVKGTGRGGSFDAVVTVSGDCTVYDESAHYILKFNVSSEMDKVVPVELQCNDETNTSDEEINLFLNSVYENYIGDKKEQQESDDSFLEVENNYVDKMTGTYEAEDGSEVIISKEGDEFLISISIFRLTSIDDSIGTVVDEETMMFRGTDASGEPIGGQIEWNDNYSNIVLKFTDSTWEYLPNGTEIYFQRSN